MNRAFKLTTQIVAAVCLFIGFGSQALAQDVESIERPAEGAYAGALNECAREAMRSAKADHRVSRGANFGRNDLPARSIQALRHCG